MATGAPALPGSPGSLLLPGSLPLLPLTGTAGAGGKALGQGGAAPPGPPWNRGLVEGRSAPAHTPLAAVGSAGSVP